MNPNVKAYIESGVLELYVMGASSPAEALAVEQMAAAHPEVRQELENISLALEGYARAHAVTPRNTVKPLLLATIDYMERLKHGEVPATPPVITPESHIADFATWLDREDMVLPPDADSIYVKIIGYTPDATTAIVWIKEEAAQEVHHDEHERFLIVEGTCDIVAGEDIHQLAAGDYYAVPLHTAHTFKVTSAVPCKAVLQRLAVA
ncbi:cupin domain-containing protein [Pontibacter russatus]|uniref:cupin domain-containing protein n=1 Tax=Pontibacter russatus TaxID=2694929 RepID=UPI00137ADF73|nr:cupin domain-containing protein [Pontibacter russatus]